MHYQSFNENYRYILYARKSSEEKDRQIISIASQIEALKDHFPNINIVEIVTESKSAFKPDNRPAFKEMLLQLKKGKADGIISWHPDRLSRNARDAGELIQLLNDAEIKDFAFANYFFINTPEGVMNLQSALSQSQYYSAKLSSDVKRGQLTKLKAGWRPNAAPQGYLNDYEAAKGNKTIKVDPERFVLIQKAWEKMATGLYSIKEVAHTLNHEWGYRSRKTKRRGGNPLSVSAVHRFLTNRFYTGYIQLPDSAEMMGKHKPMISVKTFEKVQNILHNRLKGKRSNCSKLEFVYKPLLSCGECQGTITAERKFKPLKNGQINEHRYYHCTWNKPGKKCKQRSIEEQNITFQLERLLENIELLPFLKTWGMQYLKDTLANNLQQLTTVSLSQEKALKQLEKRKENLTKKFVDGLLEKEEYLKMKKEINEEITGLTQSKSELKREEQAKDKIAHDRLNLMEKGMKILKKGSVEQKRDLLNLLASNFLVKDRKLVPVLQKWVVMVQDFKDQHKDKMKCFEPSESLDPSALSGDDKALFLHWRRVVHDLRTL